MDHPGGPADTTLRQLQCLLVRSASLADAKVSGCYFPPEIPATEIQLSVSLGTRLRHRLSKN